MSVIALIGDSLSVGAYPSLDARVGDAELFARVGASIAWMNAEVDDVVAKAPRKVLVMGGTNDLVGADASTVLSRLQGLVSRLVGRGLEVVVSTIPPQNTPNAPKVDAYNKLILSSSWPKGSKAVDVGGAIALSDLSADGIHPKPQSYPKLGNAWADVAGSGPKVSPVVATAGVSSDEPSVGATFLTALGVGTLVYFAFYRRR